ncbi:PTS fructose transporter subunit EIIC [Pectinatus sottacetonis]|uniref:PTS fructose transporter subunit EIIC n=1 Tax=Pectinatus sottacetonis TaxID=1002795 RepID=UPI0018C61A02|nr:PTS fructose transporter subunit EIIC [Pectinatus sottacetonis]
MQEFINIFKRMREHLMNGVSYMIPVVVAGGVLMAVSLIMYGQAGVPEKGLAADIWKIGVTGIGLMVPVLSAYIAASIADRAGIAPGLISGLIAANIGAGFLGGLVSGIIAGIVCYYLKKIPLHPYIRSLEPIIIIPILGTLITSGILLWGIGTYVAIAMGAAKEFLTSMTDANKIVLGLIVGAMIAFDMGGPINKVAYSLMVATVGSGIFSYAGPCAVAIMIPPMSMAIASFIMPKKYSEEEKNAGKSAFFMSLVGITEGAIPFAANDPIRVIPSLMTGSAIGCASAYFFNVQTHVAWGGFIALPVTQNIGGFIASVIIGSVIGAVLVNLLKKNIVESDNNEENMDVELSFED